MFVVETVAWLHWSASAMCVERVEWMSYPWTEDMPADIRCDILDWDFRAYEPKSFDFIWASPPCTEYSIAKTTGVRDIEQRIGYLNGP